MITTLMTTEPFTDPADTDTSAGTTTPIDAHTATPEEKTARVFDVFQKISEDYDRVNDVISMGQHRRWKRNMVRRIVDAGPKKVLDIASGTGDIALKIAAALPSAEVIASDFSPNMLEVAKIRAKEDNLGNVQIDQQDATSLSYDDAHFDAVCVSFGLRNMPDYGLTIQEMTRVLKPGGLFLCLDSSYPTNPIIKPFFRLYFKHIMPTLGGLIAKAPDEYRWLNDSTEAFLSKDELAALMQEKGLAEVSYQSFMFGGSALHTGVKPLSQS